MPLSKEFFTTSNLWMNYSFEEFVQLSLEQNTSPLNASYLRLWSKVPPVEDEDQPIYQSTPESGMQHQHLMMSGGPLKQHYTVIPWGQEVEYSDLMRSRYTTTYSDLMRSVQWVLSIEYYDHPLEPITRVMGIIATSSPTIHQATTSLENPIITPATEEPGAEVHPRQQL